MPSEEGRVREWRGLGPRPTLRPPLPHEEEAVRRFALDLGVHPASVYTRLAVLEIPQARYFDVFDVGPWVYRVAASLGAFSAGFYLGYIEEQGFRPGLPLAWRLARLCGARISCHAVDEFGEKVFLYGKPVFEDHVTRWGRGLSVVLGPRGDPLGWGVVEVKAKRGRRALVPVADLGWYLRRGG